ncbi:MAG: NUDIX hydrolase [Thiomargarita sp.]|nr:NUDIX hydrolase [Thiomargarita sp.]
MEINPSEFEIWTPHVTVAAIIEDKGRFLLVEEEADGLVVFNQPAGHVDEEETVFEAVARETLEESAWHFTPEFIVSINQYTSPANNISYLRINFSGQHYDHRPDLPLDTGILRAIWLSREEINYLDNLRSPLVLHSIDAYIANNRYPLSLITQL